MDGRNDKKCNRERGVTQYVLVEVLINNVSHHQTATFIVLSATVCRRAWLFQGHLESIFASRLTLCNHREGSTSRYVAVGNK